ncbi:hypothetical protein PO909_012478 [Leuciscus waleckii]
MAACGVIPKRHKITFTEFYLTRRRGRPPASAYAPAGPLIRPQRGASRRQAAQPVSDTAKPGGKSPSCVASQQLGAVRGFDYAFIAHSDPASGCPWAFQARSLSSTSLPHTGYVCGTPGSLARRHPPKFRAVRYTPELSECAPVMRTDIAVLLGKGGIEPVPPANMKAGFYGPYFIVPKKGGYANKDL